MGSRLYYELLASQKFNLICKSAKYVSATRQSNGKLDKYMIALMLDFRLNIVHANTAFTYGHVYFILLNIHLDNKIQNECKPVCSESK